MMKPGLFVSTFLAVVFLWAPVLFAQGELYDKGLGAYLKKNYVTAVRCLKEYVRYIPDSEAYYLLGYASYELERKGKRLKGLSDSAEYFREAYLLDPDVSMNFLRKKKR